MQSRNKQDTIYTTIDGIKKPLISWAEENGIKYKTIMTRFYRGWRGEKLIKGKKCIS
jgi:hypothetical protein